LFTTGYKRLAEGGCKAFWMEGFLMGSFLAGGRLLKGDNELMKGRIAEGKRIAEGELLKRG
jgi:hypothetical protein